MLSDSCLIGNFIKHIFQFFAERLTKECISTDPIQCSDWENEGLVAELTLAGRTHQHSCPAYWAAESALLRGLKQSLVGQHPKELSHKAGAVLKARKTPYKLD